MRKLLFILLLLFPVHGAWAITVGEILSIISDSILNINITFEGIKTLVLFLVVIVVIGFVSGFGREEVEKQLKEFRNRKRK